MPLPILLEIENFTHDDWSMRSRLQVVAWILGIALLIVVIYPWTSVLPAPHVKYSALLSILSCVLCAVFAAIASFSCFRFSSIAVISEQHSQSERLALICTRLC